MAQLPTQDEHLLEPIEDVPLLRKRPMEDPEIDITPMIDITFLLLIFFLVAARLDEDVPVELPPARHGTAVAVKGSAILTLAQAGGPQALVYRGDGKAAGRLIEGSDPEAQEDSIVSYIEEQLREGKQHVLIKAEKGVRHRDVARVTSAVGKAGSGTLYVAVLEIQ